MCMVEGQGIKGRHKQYWGISNEYGGTMSEAKGEVESM